MPGSLSRAWDTLLRDPLMILPPMLWELAVLAVLSLLRIWPGAPATGLSVKVLPPPTLPLGSDLLEGISAGKVASFPTLLAWLILMIGSSFVTAGQLGLLHRATRRERSDLTAWVESAGNFGGRMIQWNLAVGLALFCITLLVVVSPILVLPVALAGLVAVFAFYLVPWLVVAEDLTIREAIAQPPGRLMRSLGSFAMVLLASAAVSLVLSMLLSPFRPGSVVVAIPLWAWFGTWTSLAVFEVLDQ